MPKDSSHRNRRPVCLSILGSPQVGVLITEGGDCNKECIEDLEVALRAKFKQGQLFSTTHADMRKPGDPYLAALGSDLLKRVGSSIWQRLVLHLPSDITILCRLVQDLAEPFRFLDLATELRLHVYEYSIGYQEYRLGQSPLALCPLAQHSRRSLPSLLGVCKLLRAEATEPWMTQAKFVLQARQLSEDVLLPLHVWRASLPGIALQWLRSFEVRIGVGFLTNKASLVVSRAGRTQLLSVQDSRTTQEWEFGLEWRR